MTPKEKANELWAKMLGGYEGNELTLEIDKLIAKQDALICVDEMLDFAYDVEWEKKEDALSKIKFLKEFKQEIKKL
jgi:hypothetical protein